MTEHSHRERRPRSLFGPIVLIAIGVFFLFNRANLPTDLYLWDVVRLWPLLLVFSGLNLLVLQAPRPYGSLLSGLVALAAVLLFGYVLLNGLGGTLFGRRLAAGDWQTDTIQFSADDVETADYDIVIGPPGAEVYALEDSRQLIAGTILYQDDYRFDTGVAGGRATIRLAPQYDGSDWRFWSNLGGWNAEADRWQLGLNSNVPAAILLETHAGRSRLDLRQVALDSLRLTANGADVDLLLPGGDYDANLSTNGATVEITLPEDGRHDIELEVNAGQVVLHLPPDMAARVEVDRALGILNIDDDVLPAVAGREDVYETAGYGRGGNRLDLNLDISVGLVTID